MVKGQNFAVICKVKMCHFDFATYRSALNTLRAQVANISTGSLMEKKIHLVISEDIIGIDLDMKI